MTFVIHLGPHVGISPLAEIDSSSFMAIDVNATEIATVRRLKAFSSKGEGAGESRSFDGRDNRRNGRTEIVCCDMQHCDAVWVRTDGREVIEETPLFPEQPQDATGGRNDLHLATAREANGT